MSNPVTNVEIEDVLSSIRRLVADGDRRDEELAATPETPSVGAGPLVLTQALRIEDGKTDSAGDDGPADLTDDPLAVARRVARLEAAVTVQDNEFEPDGSEDAAPLNWGRESDTTPVFQSRTRAAGTEVRGEDAPVSDDAAPTTLPQPPAGDSAGTLAADNQADKPLFLSHRLSVDPVTSTPRPEVPAEDDDEEADQFLEGLLGAEVLPEEEILRDLIAEILRDELAGALGERITRNVRKLVRREIFRILESQEQE